MKLPVAPLGSVEVFVEADAWPDQVSARCDAAGDLGGVHGVDTGGSELSDLVLVVRRIGAR